jgi:hypothetical protein
MGTILPHFLVFGEGSPLHSKEAAPGDYPKDGLCKIQ